MIWTILVPTVPPVNIDNTDGQQEDAGDRAKVTNPGLCQQHCRVQSLILSLTWWWPLSHAFLHKSSFICRPQNDPSFCHFPNSLMMRSRLLVTINHKSSQESSEWIAMEILGSLFIIVDSWYLVCNRHAIPSFCSSAQPFYFSPSLYAAIIIVCVEWGLALAWSKLNYIITKQTPNLADKPKLLFRHSLHSTKRN